ncbi:MAG: RNA polymerase sigma factor [Clostridiales Family XIII bacterium]|nr:RNA polymerase sigma factor [Clostridiales Family XIII bacterium]
MDAEFEQLYNAYYMKVFSFVLVKTGNHDLSEELTQKTFYKAWTTESKYRGGSTEFTWLCAIAKRLIADAFRERSRRSEFPGEKISDVDLENALVGEDTAFRAHQALHMLEEPYKEVFQLRVFGELAFRQIALLFGKTENWARVTYHRARLKIQERMESQ